MTDGANEPDEAAGEQPATLCAMRPRRTKPRPHFGEIRRAARGSDGDVSLRRARRDRCAALRLRPARRAPRAERRRALPARRRPDHRRSSPGGGHLPRRRHGVASARRVPRAAPISTSRTSARSTAPTSTVYASRAVLLARRCRGAGRQVPSHVLRSRVSTSPHRSSSDAPAPNCARTPPGTLGRVQLAPPRHPLLSIGQVLARLTRSSPTCRRPSCAFLEERQLVTPARTDPATASSRPPTSNGCASCSPCSATTTCR